MGKKKRQSKRDEDDLGIEFEEVEPEEELSADADGDIEFDGELEDDEEGLEAGEEEFEGAEEGEDEGAEEDELDEEEGVLEGEEEGLQGSIGEFEEETGDGETASAALELKNKVKEAKNSLGNKSVSLAERREKLLRQRLSFIQCKERRLKLLDKRKHEMQIVENKRRRELRKQNKQDPSKMVKPITIEDARETDKTFIFDQARELDDDEEHDEFSRFFKQEADAKVLLTTDENPTRHIFEYIKELKEMIPNSYFYPRKKFPLATVCRLATGRDFTHVMVVRQRLKEPYQMVMICLPIGPSIIFKLSSVKLRREIEFKGAPTGHKPELILKNFNTSTGRRVGRFFASMFDMDPEFRGRTVVSFLNMRDFIFVRHHRYIFKENGTKCGLQEIGPRFTLKVKKVLEGTFEKFNRVEWLAKDKMYVSRKKVYL